MPGVLVLALLAVRTAARATVRGPARESFSWSALHGRLRAMIVAAGGLALASVPEVFVVLWATQAGMAVEWVPLVWAAASLAKMAIAMPAGIVSDRLGRTPVLLGGWTARVAALLLLAFVPAPSAPVGLGVVRRLLRDARGDRTGGAFADRRSRRRHRERGTAYGLYHLTSGLLVLPGAVIFGCDLAGVWFEHWHSSRLRSSRRPAAARMLAGFGARDRSARAG